MEDEQVIEQSTPPPDKGGKPAKEPETVSIPKAEWERVQRQVTELTESERYWATRARGGDEPEAEEEEIDTKSLVPEVTGNDDVDEAIFNDPDKWTDAISKGPAAIEKFIKKAGYLKADEVAQIAVRAARQEVQTATQRFTSDNAILSQFPELRDKNSELWKETAKNLQEMVGIDKNAAKTPAALFAAAKLAKATLGQKQPARDRGGRFAGDDDVYDRYDEDERRARVDAQGGSRSRRGGEPDDDQDMLGPDLKQMCKDMGVSEADFLKNRRVLNSERGRRR
jgi:hypothetical protein